MPKVTVLTQTLPYIGLRPKIKPAVAPKKSFKSALPSFSHFVRPKLVKQAKVHRFNQTSKVRIVLGYGLAVVNVVSFVLYFFGVNQGVAKGYEIKKIQNNISKLQEANQQLTLKASEVGSILRIQQELASSGFVPANGGLYLQTQQYSQR